MSTEPVPTPDLRTRLATSLQYSFIGAKMHPLDTEHLAFTVGATERAADDLLSEVVEPELARLRDEVERLRARIHEAVDETQRRFAPFQSRCHSFDVWSKWAREMWEKNNGRWGMESEATRLVTLSLLQERDEALAEIERLRAELESSRSGQGAGNTIPHDAAERESHLRRLVADLQGARDVDLNGAFAAGFADGQVQAGNDLEALLDHPAAPVVPAPADQEDRELAEDMRHHATFNPPLAGGRA